MPEITLTTPCGPLRGVEENGCRIFRGIRYAATARFEKPRETTRWDGVFDAVQNGPDCFQAAAFLPPQNGFYDREFGGGPEHRYTEDFVTLDLAAPADAKGCPILVFVHGGGHESGAVGDLPYGCCTEYARRGVIFVSVGYRLGVLSLFRCQNLGLFDLMTALAWVRHNAAAFGGDPERITGIGQSAGAMMLSDLCLCPAAAPLLRGAVLMSGGGAVPHPLRPCTRAEADPFWDEVRAAAGAASDAALRALPAETVWRAWLAVRRKSRSLRLAQPGIDGEILRGEPERLLRGGALAPVPVILGVTAQDYLPLFLYGMARRWAAAAAQKGAAAYGYFFDHPLPGDRRGAWHACDLWYLFGGMEHSWRPFAPEDQALSRQIIDRIAQFAKTGDPNLPGLPDWPALTASRHDFLRLDTAGPALAGPARCRAAALQSALFRRGPL